MPKSNPQLITALRDTAKKLQDGARYEWGHMGRCNCGHLVQTITELSDREIVAKIDHQLNEWTEHANDYCTHTGGSIDEFFEVMKANGFNHEDMVKLEYLSDKEVLSRLDCDSMYLRHNDRNDVVLYMEEMANMLEEELQPA